MAVSVYFCVCYICCQAEEDRDGMEKVKLDNRRILFNLLPAHVAQHFLLSNPRNMVSLAYRQADRKTDKQVDNRLTKNVSEDIKGHILYCYTVFFLSTLGSILSVLRTSWCPVCLDPKLQWFLHWAGWQQHGSGVPETTEWDHRWFWWGGMQISFSQLWTYTVLLGDLKCDALSVYLDVCFAAHG